MKSCKLDPLNEKAFFEAAVACDLYKTHTNKSICPKRVQVKLRLYFSNIIAENDYWNYKNIFFFKNVVMLLNGKEAYKFAYDLLDYAKHSGLFIRRCIFYIVITTTPKLYSNASIAIAVLVFFIDSFDFLVVPIFILLL